MQQLQTGACRLAVTSAESEQPADAEFSYNIITHLSISLVITYSYYKYLVCLLRKNMYPYEYTHRSSKIGLKA